MEPVTRDEILLHVVSDIPHVRFLGIHATEYQRQRLCVGLLRAYAYVTVLKLFGVYRRKHAFEQEIWVLVDIFSDIGLNCVALKSLLAMQLYGECMVEIDFRLPWGEDYCS